MIQSLNKLYTLLGYRFNNSQLLKQALTHKSYGNKHNERLEFLGDAIINFIASELLFQKFDVQDEGHLTRSRSYLVKGDMLAEIAVELSLGEFLLMSQGEEKSGGRQRKSILANALEAVIAAIYLDGGDEVCKKIVSAWLKPRFEALEPDEELKDAKTLLQEYTQSRALPLPKYTVFSLLNVNGSQIFRIQCQIPGIEAITLGEGGSRRTAEQHAAKEYIKLLKANEKHN